MIKKIVIGIALVLALAIGAFILLNHLGMKKREAIISDYETIIGEATTCLNAITDRASLDDRRAELDAVLARYAENQAALSDTVFTIQDARALRTMARSKAVDEPMKETRSRVIRLFDGDPDLQRELIELLKPMPHMQARMDGKLELEREFSDLFR